MPSESFPNSPVIEILSYRRVFIEHHKGIAEYSSSKIIVNVCYGQICILGERLELAEMTQASLVITGLIHCVNLKKNER